MTALPAPLATGYHVVVLGAGAPALESRLRLALVERLADLGTDVANGTSILSADEIDATRPTIPAVAIYLGGDSTTHAAEVERLVRDSVPILPIVPTLDGYTGLVPPALHPINALHVDWAAPNFADAVNVVLENLGLLRRTRRLFLSYLRRESTAVAHQLRVAFDDVGYDTFLDTSSVPKGDEFQPVLWHRLLDSDVMVVLDTPNFMTSRWTTEEVAQAHAMSVGIVRVIWPGASSSPVGDLALHVELSDTDLSNGELKNEALVEVVTATEALRARCLAARHQSLVAEFCTEAMAIGASTAIQPERYVVATLPGGKRIAAVPAVGVPDATLYHDASRRFPSSSGLADEAVLLYDHRGMLPAWASTLDWLDEYLPVRGLRVTDTASRLRALK